MKVILEDIQVAPQTIQNFINLTPCDYFKSCFQLMGCEGSTEQGGGFEL